MNWHAVALAERIRRRRASERDALHHLKRDAEKKGTRHANKGTLFASRKTANPQHLANIGGQVVRGDTLDCSGATFSTRIDSRTETPGNGTVDTRARSSSRLRASFACVCAQANAHAYSIRQQSFRGFLLRREKIERRLFSPIRIVRPASYLGRNVNEPPNRPRTRENPVDADGRGGTVPVICPREGGVIYGALSAYPAADEAVTAPLAAYPSSHRCPERAANARRARYGARKKGVSARLNRGFILTRRLVYYDDD